MVSKTNLLTKTHTLLKVKKWKTLYEDPNGIKKKNELPIIDTWMVSRKRLYQFKHWLNLSVDKTGNIIVITLNQQERWTGTQHYYGPASTRDGKECNDGPPHHKLHNNGGSPHLTIPQCVLCDFQRWPQSVVEVPEVLIVLQHDYQEYVRSQWLWLSKKVKWGSGVLIFRCDL